MTKKKTLFISFKKEELEKYRFNQKKIIISLIF